MQRSVRLAEAHAGMRATFGFGLSVILFGGLFGVAGLAEGMPVQQIVAMSAIMFAAAAQFAALELWQTPLPYLTLALSAALISARNLLLGLALGPRFDGASRRARVLAAALMTDANAILTISSKGRQSPIAFYIGSGVLLFCTWMAGTFAGVVASGLLDAVTLEALGFSGAVLLTILMVMLARSHDGPRSPWLAAAGAAVLLELLRAPPTLILLSAVGAAVIVAIALEGRRDA